MTDKVIVWTNEELGNVAVCYPTGSLPIEEVLKKDAPVGAIIVDAESLPEADSDFYQAWRLVDGKVTVDLEVAKEVQRNRLRAARTPRLAALDVAYLQALEDGRDTSGIVAQKRTLRDITTSSVLANATSTDEIRSYWPSVLDA